MCFNAVITYTQYLGIEALKFLYILLESQQFTFSDRAEISKVKGKHHIFYAAVIKQIDGTFVRDGLKQGSFFTSFKRSSQDRCENQKAG